MDDGQLITPHDDIFNIDEIYRLDPNGLPLSIPLYEDPISAGFPSPADGMEQVRLSPNDYLVKNEPSTFFARFKGDSLKDLGIRAGQIAVVDKSEPYHHGSLVVAVLDNKFTGKILRDGYLEGANRERPVIIPFDKFESVSIWGVITGTMWNLRGKRF